MLFFKNVVYQLIDKEGQDGNDRNAEEHSKRPCKSAADRNGKDNGNRLEAGGFSENLWSDDRTV